MGKSSSFRGDTSVKIVEREKLSNSLQTPLKVNQPRPDIAASTHRNKAREKKKKRKKANCMLKARSRLTFSSARFDLGVETPRTLAFPVLLPMKSCSTLPGAPQTALPLNSSRSVLPHTNTIWWQHWILTQTHKYKLMTTLDSDTDKQTQPDDNTGFWHRHTNIT